MLKYILAIDPIAIAGGPVPMFLLSARYLSNRGLRREARVATAHAVWLIIAAVALECAFGTSATRSLPRGAYVRSVWLSSLSCALGGFCRTGHHRHEAPSH